MIRAGITWIFFDVGDTLLDECDSMADWCRQVAEELSRRGHAVTQADVWAARERAYAEFAPDVLARILQILGTPNESSVYEVARYQHALERTADGADEVLAALAKRFSLGVIANQARGTADRLRQRGWSDYFKLCISSTEAGLRKPNPAIFQLALNRANCPPNRAVMIGDRIDNDIRPAKSIGMATIRIRQGISRIQQPQKPEDQPDATIENLRELPGLLHDARRG